MPKTERVRVSIGLSEADAVRLSGLMDGTTGSGTHDDDLIALCDRLKAMADRALDRFGYEPASKD